MELAGYVVNAVVLEGRSVREVARAHGVSKSWLYELLARYREKGEEGLEARSKRPRSSPRRLSSELEEEVVELRKSLAEEGLDAGAHTIQYHLLARGRAKAVVPSVSSIWRLLARRGFIVPQPQKPRCSYVHFCAELRPSSGRRPARSEGHIAGIPEDGCPPVPTLRKQPQAVDEHHRRSSRRVSLPDFLHFFLSDRLHVALLSLDLRGLLISTTSDGRLPTTSSSPLWSFALGSPSACPHAPLEFVELPLRNSAQSEGTAVAAGRSCGHTHDRSPPWWPARRPVDRGPSWLCSIPRYPEVAGSRDHPIPGHCVPPIWSSCLKDDVHQRIRVPAGDLLHDGVGRYSG
jgi:transposase